MSFYVVLIVHLDVTFPDTVLKSIETKDNRNRVSTS